MVELQHVSKVFPTENGELQALRDVNLSIRDGEIYGIIGYSGAGKSTLVRCINLLEKPTTGTVTVDGTQLCWMEGERAVQLPEKELRQARKKISMIFQLFNLMPSRTVAQNVAFPLKRTGLGKEAVRKKVMDLLAMVDLPDKASAYPSQLSGGQKQRVAIARALASDPKVLLCDEATSALDPQTTHSILKLIERINRETGITVVVITHEMAVVKEICSRVAVMEKGCVVEQGSVYDIFSNPQQPVTRSFVNTTSNLGKIEELIAANDPLTAVKPGEIIARLTYSRDNVAETTISEVSRRFGINVNILYSNIEILDGAPLGGIVAIIGGERVREAVQWLSERNVMLEVLKRG